MPNTTTAAKQSNSQLHLSKGAVRSRPASRDDEKPVKQASSSEEVRAQIAQAAYYRALQRGLTPGFEVEDWVQAEAEVLKRLEAGPKAT